MPNVEHGCLAVADISGYTRFLTGVELEHSTDLLADLLNTIAAAAHGALTMAKVEGDAIFWVEAGSLGGTELLTLVDGLYAAFHRRLRDIRHLTTCECEACRQIPNVDLKVIVHRGDYGIHEIAGSREVVGREVILVHRLLKNTAVETFGHGGYALLTAAVIDELDLDPQGLDARPHNERYDEFGPVATFVLDLSARWQAAEERSPVYIGTEQSTLVEVTLPAAPAVIWEWMTDPRKRQQWNGADRIDTEDPEGGRGVGTRNHCVHGKMTVEEEVLDWRPHKYLTLRARMPVMQFVFTLEVTPADSGERSTVTLRTRRDDERFRRRMFAAFEKGMGRKMTKDLSRLAALLTS